MSLYNMFHEGFHTQRATTWEIVELATEQICGCNLEFFPSSSSLFVEKAGFLGIVIAIVSLFSIEETSNIDGLSIAFS